MRKIKFRAWDKINKVMQYSKIDWGIILDNNISLNFPALTGFNDNDDIYSLSDLMQYTGLKDKNGTEIYEGDIVKTSEDYLNGIQVGSRVGNIEWLETDALWYISGDVEDGLGDVTFDTNVEVIGNIYQNPELLDNK